MLGYHSAYLQDSSLLGYQLSVVWRCGGGGGGAPFIFECRRALTLEVPPKRSELRYCLIQNQEPPSRIEPENSRKPPQNSVFSRLLAFSWIIGVLLAHAECSLRSHLLTSTVVAGSLVFSSLPAKQYRNGVCISTATSCIPESLCSNFAVHFDRVPTEFSIAITSVQYTI